MINIVITAGGTIENIDEVRKITNTSTGMLGAFICDEVIKYFSDRSVGEHYTIHYIMSKTAYKPLIKDEFIDNVIFYETTDTKSVEYTIRKVLHDYKVNYFIHSMAISDFYTSNIVSIDDLANEIYDAFKNQSNNKELIKDILTNPKTILDKNKKVSSKSDIMITLRRTPKIISMIKEKNKNIFLVGFKLLKNVTEEELVDAANTLAIKNSCDMVLANDLKYINEGRHIGLIIKDNKIVDRYIGKEKIAKGIVTNMFKGRMA